MVGVRFQEPQLHSLDAWITQQDQTITRPEAIRRLIELGLEAARAAGRT